MIAASVLLPVLMFALGAWYNYLETLRGAQSHVERTVRILEEHALEVFETQRLVIDEINLRLRFMDWSREADRLDLHKMLVRLQDDLDEVSTITLIDAQGRMLASGRAYPAKPEITFADRDYFKALQAAGSTLPFVSASYRGRQTGDIIFNLANRITPGADGAFAGVIAVSADRGYFERFYRSVDPEVDHKILLARADGAILASEPPIAISVLPPTSRLRAQMRDQTSGSYTMLSQLDQTERIFAFHKIGPYPVFVRFGIAKYAALAPWRSSLVVYGIVAALASLLLLLASTLAVRQTERERIARRKWQETAAALQAEASERERVETQLRQAQKMEAVGRLTGGLAHDFNNLLTAVIGSLELVRRRPDSLDERNKKFIANALEGANRASALTSRLLTFSRQSPLAPIVLDVNTLINGMSDLLRSTLGERIVVETALAADLWPTMVDPNQLESVIVNLAVNARDAMPDGGRIRISTANIRYGAPEGEAAPGDYLVLRVADRGFGMAPEVVAQIFEPFFTTKPIGKGTGLGLSQVYGFVKQSGGHVSVESTPGLGTTFTILLPRAAETVSAVQEPEVAEGPAIMSQGQATILVVEDEAMVLRLSSAMLEEAGYMVLAARDATAAVELAEQHPEIALLFTDLVLTGPMNGRALADAILKLRPGLPVLFTTGYARQAAVAEAGGEDLELLAKPFTGDALVARVQALLARRRLRVRASTRRRAS